jgi:hypothetical protein
MLAPANFVHQHQLNGFPQDFSLAVEPEYFLQPVWNVPAFPQPPVQAPQQQGLSFGTFLAIGTTLVSAAVMFDPRASKQAKFVAQTALGVSLPFVLNEAFGLQAWPGQAN